MFILGNILLGADYSFFPTYTNIEDINYIQIKNGKYKSIAVSTDTSLEYASTTWNNSTIMATEFKKSLNAGNIDFAISSTSTMLIKRRIKGTFNWITIDVKPIYRAQDLIFSGIDYTNRSGCIYEYAAVPLLNNVEGNYSISEVSSIFNGMYLYNLENFYGTLLNIGYCDTVRNYSYQKHELPMLQKPKFYTSSKQNYDTGTCEGTFYLYDEDNCDFIISDTFNNFNYHNSIKDFLSSQVPVLLKMPDGRNWIVHIDTVNDNSSDYYALRNISFTWTEIANPDSEKDRYETGVSLVTSEYWSEV